MNTVTIIGRAGQDAEIKYFESGKVKTSFSLAVNRWDARTKEEVTDWYNIEVWDKQAEFAGEYIKRGRQVAVDGRISISKWNDASGDTFGSGRDIYVSDQTGRIQVFHVVLTTK